MNQVNDRITVPVNAIFVVTVLAALLGLINIGSTTAFNDVVSLALETFYASYLLACSLLLYRRLRGDIMTLHDDAPTPSSFVWGPWRISNVFGAANNIFACGYLIIIGFFSYWPVALPVTPANMNYTSLVTGAVILFSISYYLIWARKIFKGPIIEVDLHTF